MVIGPRKILEVRPEKSTARILLPRLISRLRQSHKRVMLAYAKSMRIGLVQAGLRIRGKSQQNLDFRIQREIATVLGVNQAAVFIESPIRGRGFFIARGCSSHDARRSPQL